MKSHLFKTFTALAACAIMGLPGLAQAQVIAYADVSGSGDEFDAGDVNDGDAGGNNGPSLSVRTKKVTVVPYIEAQQVDLAELSPGNEVLTYSTLAAGIDASVTGRNSQGALSVRYERRFGYGNHRVPDSDVVSGVGRASFALVPRALTIEAGAMAARMSVEGNGAALNGRESNSTSQIYGAYIGPSLTTQLGDLMVSGHYRFGYNRVEAPGAVLTVPGQNPVDVFDEGTVHNAEVHAGLQPGTVFPIGIGVGAGWNREDVSNFDQRIDDKHVRGDVTLPLGPYFALVAGLGYEAVKVSHRDALRELLSGLPVVGTDGRYVVDKTQPRQIAYESEGLIWDAGVLWRPSKRTALEAHVGRRYGSTSYYGSFAYAPNAHTSLNVSVYDNVTGFGGMLSSRLAGMPTQFDASRNPLNGDLGACVAASATVGSGESPCFGGALASVNSASFRGRGVMGSLNFNHSRLQYGIGAGYDRRRFIAAPGTILATANGVTDENVWMGAYLNGKLDRKSTFGTTMWASWYQSGDTTTGDTSAYGATAAYYRSLTSRITATAALGVEGVQRELIDDVWTAQALVGIRYSF